MTIVNGMSKEQQDQMKQLVGTQRVTFTVNGETQDVPRKVIKVKRRT